MIRCDSARGGALNLLGVIFRNVSIPFLSVFVQRADNPAAIRPGLIDPGGKDQRLPQCAAAQANRKACADSALPDEAFVAIRLRGGRCDRMAMGADWLHDRLLVPAADRDPGTDTIAASVRAGAV